MSEWTKQANEALRQASNRSVDVAKKVIASRKEAAQRIAELEAEKDAWQGRLYAVEGKAEKLEQELAGAVLRERERCAVIAWNKYMDTCKKNGIGPAGWEHWCAAAAIRGQI